MKNIIITIILTIGIQLSAQTMVTDTYISNKNITWTKAGSPYIIRTQLSISSSTLNIVDAKIIFEDSSISFFKNSVINMNNVEIEGNNSYNNNILSLFHSKLFINNLNLNTDRFIEMYNSDVNIDNLSSFNSGKGFLFSIYNNSNFSLINSHVENYKGSIFNTFNTNKTNIQNTEFINNNKVMELWHPGAVTVNNNDFEHNKVAIESYSDGNFENNYFEKDKPIIFSYTSDAGPTENNILSGPFKIQNFSKDKNIKKPGICCSNIVFLPGLMGSRLYMDNKSNQNQLWEPNRNTDVKKLFLDQFGKSINTIYTKDIIAKTNIIGGLPGVDQSIYKNFISYLGKLKKDKNINNYISMPYDWRMSVDYILTNGVLFKDKNIDLIKSVQDLQKTSKTKKVTIITHSNGGLVAKQFILELQKAGLENMIDKVIFIAMPEYGTPQAITSLLYGHEQSIAGGLILKSSIAEQLGKNMPTAYALLPSEKYYTHNNIGKILQQSTVNNYPNLNSSLFNKAKVLHQQLDNIIYPKNIQIYQILGTGINTVSDIKIDNENKIIPIYNKDGDGVVQDLSSSRYGTTTYIDLKDTLYKHANIMNNEKIISSIDNIIKPQDGNNTTYGLDYNKIIKNNNYKLLKITNSEDKNKGSKYLAPLDIDLSLGITKLNNNPANGLFIDKYNSNTLSSFDNIIESLNNNNRFELYDKSINYLYTNDIDNFSINSKVNSTIDISILESVDGEISELEYKNIPVFKNSKMIFESEDDFNNLHINLPLTGQTLSFENNKNKTMEVINIDETINKIIAGISASHMEKYLKDRYIRRIEVYRKNKDEKYLITLKKRVTDAIDSMNKLSYSAVLKSRYSKLKEGYIYLNLLLLKL